MSAGPIMMDATSLVSIVDAKLAVCEARDRVRLEERELGRIPRFRVFTRQRQGEFVLKARIALVVAESALRAAERRFLDRTAE
ncbi:MAG: hypothetical protein Q8P41_31725 [Pseudomonadota bacterium]|nr:hypothetical protein [Pseudomonadota bacterium]